MNAEIWVHTCWGNPNQQRVHWKVPSYERALPHLRQPKCDVLTIEFTVLGVPCLTFRENTERPITVTEGTNQLIGRSPLRLASALDALLSRPSVDYRTPELWDGRAAHRILDVLQPERATIRMAA